MFKVGDRVRVIASGRCYPTYEQWPGLQQVPNRWVKKTYTINGVEGVILALAPHTALHSGILALVRGGDYDFIISIDGIELMECPIDLTKITTTRSGNLVHSVENYEDGLRAHVEHHGRKLSIRYGLDGRFMPGHDNPIDLVEAQ